MGTVNSFPIETTPLATALQAINFELYEATSTTSVAIGTGTKVFATAENKDFSTGDFIIATSDANPANYMVGQVVSYIGAALTLSVPASNYVGGSGTHADWTLRVSGPPGATGPVGAAAWSPPTAWLTATAYTIGPPASTVIFGGETYVALQSHTSGTFATDLAASRWVKVAQKGSDGTVAVSGTPSVGQFSVWTNSTTLKGVSISGLLKGNGASDPTAAVAGTDYLAPAAIGTTVQAFDAQLFSNIPQNSKSAAYTLILTDAQKHIFHPSADTTARIWTIPANSSVAFPIGTAVTFINQNAGGVITIAITSDTMRLAGAGTTGSRTLAANGVATAIKVTATEWIISGTGLT